MTFFKQNARISSKELSSIPGDKSISHRAVIMGSLANNNSVFEGFLCAEDCLNTAKIFQQLSVPVTVDVSTQTLRIEGQGLGGLKPSDKPLYVGNSGTGIRLISGVLAGQRFESEILGDDTIQKRPMSRIIDPLRLMGATIHGQQRDDKEYAPLHIQPAEALKAMHYELPMPSAQVKSAVLLASLFADGVTEVYEPIVCRNHSEVMLKQFGADIHVSNKRIRCSAKTALQNPFEGAIQIPSDFSSASFFIVLALLLPNSELCLKHIGLNPTRCRLIHVLQEMGANIRIENEVNEIESYGDIIVSSSSLHNIEVKAEDIPIIIDEIPILAVAALFATGTLVLKNAEELRVKESDRIRSIVLMVEAFGGDIEEFEDGFALKGGVSASTVSVQTFYDHRIAMSAVIAACVGSVELELDNSECIHTSFPNFFDCLDFVLS